jgi:hypothetical protein
MAKAPKAEKVTPMNKPVDTSSLDNLKENLTQAENGTEIKAVHVPVLARGFALLKLISEAPEKYLLLTELEGREIVDNGFASLDRSIQAGGASAVRLTDKGVATVNAQTATRAARSTTTVSANVRSDIPAPGKRKGGKKGSKYPFDTIEVGSSFHIPATLENTDPLYSVASSLTFARAKFSVPVIDETTGVPVLETVNVKTYEKDDAGKIVKDAEGHRVVASEASVTRPKMKLTKDFTAAAVDASDPDGVGARVWRIA